MMASPTLRSCAGVNPTCDESPRSGSVCAEAGATTDSAGRRRARERHRHQRGDERAGAAAPANGGRAAHAGMGGRRAFHCDQTVGLWMLRCPPHDKSSTGSPHVARVRTAKAAIAGKAAADARRPRRRPPLAKSADNQHFTHFDARGQAHMVDVADKDVTKRVARAGGRIVMRAATLAMVRAGDAKKGDVLGIARIAAIMAAKRTADLIPLCHPLPLTRVAVAFVARRRRPGDRDRGHGRNARPHRRGDGGARRRCPRAC